MANRLRLHVLTPYKSFLDEEVDSVMIPSIDGFVGIMRNHSPLQIVITPGITTIVESDKRRYFSISEGFAKITGDTCLLVCNSAEWPEEIDVRRIGESYKSYLVNRKNIEAIENELARKSAQSDNEQQLSRIMARKKIVELYGSKNQKMLLDSMDLG